MRSTIAATLAILALTACDIPIKKAPPAEQGLGAGAAPTTTPAATPAATPVDSPAMQPNAPVQPVTAAKKPARVTDQTQSGVTDKSGASTLGKNIRKARPDQDQPVTAKGDVVVARWDSAAGGWTYKKLGDTTTAVRTPGPMKGDTAFNQQKGDSLKPVAPPATPVVPADTTLGPMKGDSALKRTQPDSLRIQGNDSMPASPAPMPIQIPVPAPAPKDSVKP